MSDVGRFEPSPVPAVLLIHQEGVLTVVALVGLSFGESGVLGGLAPTASLLGSVAVGVAAGALLIAVLWAARSVPPLRRLETWQRAIVADWTVTDAVSVAVISGLAEEALLRAFLQPVIGLIPAALLFAALHLVPSRELWFWPVFALACGVLLGVLFSRFGYPSAAAAHVVINLVALLRLRRPIGE